MEESGGGQYSKNGFSQTASLLFLSPLAFSRSPLSPRSQQIQFRSVDCRISLRNGTVYY